MQQIKLVALIAWACLALGSVCTAQLARIGALSAAGASDELKRAVEDNGYRLVLDQGWTAEFWFVRQLKTETKDTSGALYPELTNGEFVGVVDLPQGMTDFRGQAIPAGAYTLRYQLIPQDGNHMGVNPTRDAIVLVPVAADPGPAKTLDFDSLVKLGRQASGTAHPALLVAAQPSGTSFPSVVKDDQGHWNVQAKGHTAGGDLPLAVTVVGKFEG